MDVRRTVEVKAVNKPVNELLDEVFSGTGVKYVMEGNNIVLTKKNEVSLSYYYGAYGCGSDDPL